MLTHMLAVLRQHVAVALVLGLVAELRIGWVDRWVGLGWIHSSNRTENLVSKLISV